MHPFPPLENIRKLLNRAGTYLLKVNIKTRCEVFSKLTIRGHPHSTYVQKCPKLEPLPPYTQSYAFSLTPLYAHVLSMYSCPLLINFYSDSSFRHSQFLGYFHFCSSMRLNFTKPISKRVLWFLFTS